jgi:hypothetical protein
MNTNQLDELIRQMISHSEKLKATEFEKVRYLLFPRYPHVRLSLLGDKLLKRILTSYEFPPANVTSVNKIKLYRNNDYPYYMGRTKFVLYDGLDAMSAKMTGDINKWIENNL